MSPLLHHPLVLLLLSLIISSLWQMDAGGGVGVSATCMLPTHVNTPLGWDYKIQAPGSHYSMTMHVHVPEGTQQQYDTLVFDPVDGNSDEESFTLTCERTHSSSAPDGVTSLYIMSEPVSGGTTRYHCYGFIDRSVAVIQILRSSRYSERLDTADSVCDNLDLDPWVLVAREEKVDEAVDCGLAGGITVEPFNNQGQPLVCDNRQRPVRVESGCTMATPPGAHSNMTDFTKHVTIDLNHCILEGNSNVVYPMTRDTPYRCIAHWIDGSTDESMYKYTVVSTASHDRVWLLREDNERFYLFGDIIAEPEDYIQDTENYLKLAKSHMTVTNTLCVDAMPGCTSSAWDCSETASQRHYCQLTCGLCNENLTCQFSQSTQGSWTDLSSDDSPTLTFSESSVSHQGEPWVHCQEAQSTDVGIIYSWFDIHDNGCYPNVHCVLMHPVTSSMNMYNWLSSESWPDQWMSNSCNRADVKQTGWKVLVRTGETFSCGVNHKYMFNVMYKEETSHAGVTCAGSLHHPDCDDSSLLTLTHANCTNTSLDVAQNWTCLGTAFYRDVGLTLMKSVDSPAQYTCLKHDASSTTHPLSFIPGSYCSADYHTYNPSPNPYVYQGKQDIDDGCMDTPVNSAVGWTNDETTDTPTTPSTNKNAACKTPFNQEAMLLAVLLIANYHVLGFI